MAHRILIAEKAVPVLVRLEQKLKAAGEYSTRQRNALVSQLVIDFESDSDDRRMGDMLEKITPPSRRRRALLKRLEALTTNIDEDAMRSVESSLRKLGEGLKRQDDSRRKVKPLQSEPIRSEV